jgi:hypothetical protein
MENSLTVDVLTHGLRELVHTMSERNPNRTSLNEALRYAQNSQAPGLSLVERKALIRIAAEHLRRAYLHNGDTLQDRALAAARRAMTAALFECCSDERANSA